MDTVHIMREILLSLYPISKKWRKKVAKMSDQQVIAIYLRAAEKGKGK